MSNLGIEGDVEPPFSKLFNFSARRKTVPSKLLDPAIADRKS
jgi:hypothetical protein